jgi:hypothetical protein
MKAGAHIHALKVSAALLKPSTFPVEYWSRGILAEDLKVGQPIHIIRYARAPQEEGEPATVVRPGEYQSSVVRNINLVNPDQVQVQTDNSVWLLTKLGPLTKEQEEEIKRMLDMPLAPPPINA